MTRWDHGITHKKVINLDHDGAKHVMCAWDECDKDGFDLHRVQINEGTAERPQIIKYVFCTERHKQYFINSHRRYGYLPPGFRRSII